MRPHINFFVLVIFAGCVTLGSAQEPATSTAGTPVTMTDATQTPTFPYYAEITADNVYIRTGPGLGFYDCGKFKKGDKLRIVGEQFGVWSKILPLDGSFSWISMQYVKFDPDDPSFGIVTGDNVRVYAGADNLRPAYSTRLQVKLNKNDRVKLLGEQLDNYYKIAPPAGAYLWISTEYIKQTTPPFEGPVRIAVAPAIEATGADVTADIEETSAELVSEPNDTTQVTAPSQLEKYYALQKQIDTEKVKPIGQQDYTNIKEALLEIANDKDAVKAARYAQAVIEQVKGYELAIEVNKSVKLQNEQLQKTIEQIKKARTAKLLEVEDLGRFAVIGKLDNFMTYGPGHYRVIDEKNKTICIATPSSQSSVQDLEALIGKKVGLVGTIEPNQQTAGALVRFEEAVSLE